MKQIPKHVLSMVCAVLIGACATTSALDVGMNQVDETPSALCLRQSTVVLETGGAPDIGGVSIGGGYVITDAYAPVLRSGRFITVHSEDESVAPQRAEIVKVDQGIGLALLRVTSAPACGAVLADMRSVAVGDSASTHVAGPGMQAKGQVLHPFHPFTEPGNLNDVMYLSYNMRKVPRGAGIYGEKGTLIGIRVGNPDEADVTALPADRIARFLEARHVKYRQVNDGLTIETME